MRIAVINETSAADKNIDIIKALEGRGHEIINAGMTKSGVKPELQYNHTGFMSAVLLYLKKADFVIGGCGTGQGYLNSVMQYPGVFCGHILNSLDAWLFMQINGGNCISLPLLQGYGWAGDVNLKLIFDSLFAVERGSGYPEHRKEPQRNSRILLEEISNKTHLPFSRIIENLPDSVINPVLEFPGFIELIDVKNIADKELKNIFEKRIAQIK